MFVDWSDYERVHANRRNLLIHLLAVPLFDIAFPVALISVARGEWIPAAVSVLAAIGSMALQALGHSKEANEAKPFNGPLNFLQRWLAEQYFKFPVFVITGRWWRQYIAAGISA